MSFREETYLERDIKNIERLSDLTKSSFMNNILTFSDLRIYHCRSTERIHHKRDLHQASKTPKFYLTQSELRLSKVVCFITKSVTIVVNDNNFTESLSLKHIRYLYSSAENWVQIVPDFLRSASLREIFCQMSNDTYTALSF